jgi:hypothetical protein
MSDQEVIKEKKKYVYPKETVALYNKTFREKHINNMIHCPLCVYDYSKVNSYYHPVSKRHMNAVKILENISTL